MRQAFRVFTFIVPLVVGSIAPLGSLTSAERTAPNDRLIFILAGQSNMSGRGATSDLPSGFPRNGNRLWMFTNADRWSAAAEPVDSAIGQVDKVSADETAGVGPALAFADALASALPNVEIGLVPCAKGATPIADWLPAADRSTLFGSCLRRIKLACQQGTMAAILWHQGESDAASLEDARAWGQRFQSVVEGFRQYLGAQKLMVLGATLGKLGATSDDRFRFWSEILLAQQSVRLPGVTLIDGQAFDVGKDGIHFSTAGQLDLGQALARKYLQAAEKPALKCAP